MFVGSEAHRLAVGEDHEVVEEVCDAVDLPHDQLRRVERLRVARCARRESPPRRGFRPAGSSPRGPRPPRCSRRRRAPRAPRPPAGGCAGSCCRAGRSPRHPSGRSRRRAARQPTSTARSESKRRSTWHSFSTAERPLGEDRRGPASPASAPDRAGPRRGVRRTGLDRVIEDPTRGGIGEIDVSLGVEHDDPRQHGIEHTAEIACHGYAARRSRPKYSRVRSRMTSSVLGLQRVPAKRGAARKALRVGRDVLLEVRGQGARLREAVRRAAPRGARSSRAAPRAWACGGSRGARGPGSARRSRGCPSRRARSSPRPRPSRAACRRRRGAS